MLTNYRAALLRWLPALVIMAIIFYASSFSAAELPNFDLWDTAVKKGGHMLGYALLALAYAHALKLSPRKYWLAWVLTVLYACTDEFHQTFSAGRHPSLIDVFFFDGGGAFIAVWLMARRKK